MHPALRQTDHRIHALGARHCALPRGPWRWRQSWRDLLFAHWPVPVARLAGLVPAGVDIDEHGASGTSYVGIVPFLMAGVMRRPWPDLPWISAFPELNLRLYVRVDGKPGVWFVSLDAANPLAVWAARRFFHLPYFNARMHVRRDGDRVVYQSQRRGPVRVAFSARYGPTGPPRLAAPGTLEHFLTERYCFFTTDRGGRLLCADVHHEPWPLQDAEAEIDECEIAGPQGIPLAGPPPLLHFSRRLDVVLWQPCVFQRSVADGG